MRPIRLSVLLLIYLVAMSSGRVQADDVKKDGAASQTSKTVTLARLKLKEDFPEGPAAAGLFGDLQPRLRDVIDRLDKAAKDSKISGVVLELRDPEIGLGKVAELRDAISRVRKAGKKVYADVHSATSKDYLIASACTEIVMPPSGGLMVTGLQAQVAFFKGLFDKLGIKADLIQIGDFKGAAEPFVRSEMSPEFRKQFEAVIGDYYQQMVKSIAEDRKLDPQRVKELIDEGLFTAARAKEVKLVDRVCYEDELADQLKSELKAEQLVFQKDYGKKEIDTDFSGFTGFMKLMEVMMGKPQDSKTSRAPKIAVVYAVGPITTGDGGGGLFGGAGAGSDTIIKALRKAEKEDNVKAIVLRVDSPGGSALASDLMWREIVRAKKPIVASMGDTAASGGYYISMGADKIFAEAGTLTGSIGVVGGKLALKGLFDKIGINTEVIKRGKISGALTSTDPFTPEEREAWKRVMSDIYRQFTTKAAEGRKMDIKKLEGLAAGRLFTGQMAAANGLVDKVGTLQDAIAEAKKLAGIKAEDKVDLLILPQPKSFFEQLFEGPSVESETESLAPQLLGPLKAADTLRRLFTEPAVAILPFYVEFK